jgi:predicted unusual protein kinase regulating ubiquinone biosynthesis (AarF/ABC1/UbiB family)
MADITSGRARRMLSVGRLTTAVGGSYLWQALKRPFQSARAPSRRCWRHTSGTPSASSRVRRSLRGAFMKLAQMLSMRGDILPAEALEVLFGGAVVGSADAVGARATGPHPGARRAARGDLPPVETEAFAAASLGQVHVPSSRAASGSP